jgi:hypothetical protein
MPDRVLVLPFRPDVFIEFKRPGEQPTKIQLYWHWRLRQMGKRVEVIRSLHGFRNLLLTVSTPTLYSAG